MKYDAIWYLPENKKLVIPQLNIPSAEERAARRILGVVWGPGQPKPPGDFKGPMGNWSLAFGKFIGTEYDPDTLRAQMDLEEICYGMIGGRYKPGALDTDRHEQLVHEQTAQEAALKLSRAQPARKQGNREQLENAAILKLFILTAKMKGFRRPERMSVAELQDVYNLALVTDDNYDENTLPRWVEAEIGAEELDETPQEVPLLTLEMLGDEWDKPFIQQWNVNHKREEVIKRAG